MKQEFISPIIDEKDAKKCNGCHYRIAGGVRVRYIDQATWQKIETMVPQLRCGVLSGEVSLTDYTRKRGECPKGLVSIIE
jgi:hypothetical protein